MHGRAFFLSPQGKLIRVGTSHIAEMIRHPEEFGLSLEEIEKVYQKHGERLGWEGKAREEILSRIIQKGWIRIREYPDSHWSFTLDQLTSQEKGYLQDFAQQVLSRKGAFADAGERRPDPHLAVTVSTPSWDLLSMTDLAALASEGIPLGARNRGADARWSGPSSSRQSRPPGITTLRRTPGGETVSPEQLSVAFGRACKRAGMRNLRFHDLRHDFASCLVQAGVDIYRVRELLGHRDLRMTRRYSHLSPEKLRDAVRVLDEREGGYVSVTFGENSRADSWHTS